MRVTVVPRIWATLEAHFPRASHSRPAHSSRALEAYSQLAFPRKPRLRAFPCTCGSHIRTIPRIWKPLFRTFPCNYNNVPRSSTNTQSMRPRASLRNNIMVITSRGSAQSHEVENRRSYRLTISYVNRIDKSIRAILFDILKRCFWNDVTVII